MKSTDTFKKTIYDHLQTVAKTDEAFAIKLQNPNKSIDHCITYILNTVQKSGQNGFADEEIFGMALHYYDEEKIEVGKPNNAKVIVNHHIDLSESELEAAKEKAMAQAIEEAKKDLKLTHKVELSPEDLAEVKAKAVELAVAEAKADMLKKKNKKAVPALVEASADESPKEEVLQGQLF